MQVQRVQNQQANIPVFGAKINLKSTGIADYCSYLERCKDAPKGCFSSNSNIELFSKISKAFENHPSDEVINGDVAYKSGRFNARGVLETRRGKIVDVEPSRSDDGTGPMENVFRKLLNPDNKKVLNTLLGEEHARAYDNWWNANIKPIWRDITELYKIDDTIENPLTASEYNVLFKDNIIKKYFYEKMYKNQQEVSAPKNDTTKPSFIERLKQAWKALKGN